MKIDKYRPKRREKKTFSLRINNSNFSTAGQYADLSISAHCDECNHYIFKDNPDGHE